MGKLPTGPPTAHILKSQGADTNLMKFYITQNSSTYGARFEKFKPQQGTHRGTGYLSNIRPSVFYNRRVDDVDNPEMRRICDGNYQTVTKLAYPAYRDPSGLEAFPSSVVSGSSAYVREKGLTVPKLRQAHGVHIDTRLTSAPANILPRHQPLLARLRSKDPVEAENFGYGPSYMKTETQEKFQPYSRLNMDISNKDVGPQLPSGFVRNHGEDPVTFEPKIAYQNLQPGWCTHRPTGVSVTKTSFLPKTWSRGDEALPGGVSVGAERDSGFTREETKPKYINIKAPDAYDKLKDVPDIKVERTRKQDPTEFINMQEPHNRSSLHQAHYKGLMQQPSTEIDLLNRTTVGPKMNSGFTTNGSSYVQAPDDKMRFLTHNMTRYGPDPTPVGVERAGHLRGGIQPQAFNGFTKSVSLNEFGREIPGSEVLRRVQPYVGRSLIARDAFFDDHLHDSKMRTELTA